MGTAEASGGANARKRKNRSIKKKRQTRSQRNRINRSEITTTGKLSINFKFFIKSMNFLKV